MWAYWLCKRHKSLLELRSQVFPGSQITVKPLQTEISSLKEEDIGLGLCSQLPDIVLTAISELLKLLTQLAGAGNHCHSVRVVCFHMHVLNHG